MNLLIEKLNWEKKKIITREELRGYCKALKLDYYATIGYLLRNKYAMRILRGIFYIRSIEERKLNKLDLDYREIISEALKIKKVMWYFGLETALKLDNLTHEFFTIDYIINDKMFRPRAFKILGHNIKFTKIKKKLLSFGIIKGNLPYSDKEKTVLDIAAICAIRNIRSSY